jgi:hypothetical protein
VPGITGGPRTVPDDWISIILIVAGIVAALLLVGLVVWWVRRIDDELDYPEAHGPGPTPQGRAIMQIGAGLSNSSNTPMS